MGHNQLNLLNVVRIGVAVATLFSFNEKVYSATPNQDIVLKACSVDWPPFVEVKGNKVSGIHTDILREAANRLGIKLEISNIPWKRCLDLAQKGKIDIVYPASKSEDRELYLNYATDPIQTLNYVVAVKGPVSSQWNGGNYTVLPQPIGIPLGYSVADKLKKIPGVALDQNANDDDQNVRKLQGGRLQAIVCEKIVLGHLMKQFNLTGISVLEPPVTAGKDYYVTISKQSPSADVLPKINAEIEKMRADGTIDAIASRY